jgi:hypothetical protein
VKRKFGDSKVVFNVMTCPKGEIKKDPMGVVKMCLGYWGRDNNCHSYWYQLINESSSKSIFTPKEKYLILSHFVMIYF